MSFPGEYRAFIEKVANKLAESLSKDKVFYDKFRQSELARLDLDIHIQNIYHSDTEKIVVFICAEYNKKEWCGLEWRAIRDLIKKRKSDDIILIRVGTGDVKGIYSIDGFLDANEYSENEIANFILQRL
ncbi:MAG: TIR domain-containing protein [Candidatus Scalindua sp.]